MESLQELSQSYLQASISGERQESREVIAAALARGCSVFAIYQELISPALAGVGSLWERGKITVCQEHLATQITLEQMVLLRERITPKPSLGKTVLATTLPDDLHVVGVRMVADYFYADGWNIEYLGSNTPVHEIVEHSKNKRVDVVLVSLSTPELVPICNALANELRGLSPSPFLIVGGRGISNPDARSTLSGIDIFGSDPAEAVKEARRITGISGSEASLEQVLIHIGQTIRKHRTEKGLNQKSLSEMADLDRAYLSSIENGKKNVTVSAMLRLSEALGISLEELVRG